MATIGIDIQTVVGAPAGVGHYVANLVHGLAGLPGGERFRLFCFDFRRRFAGLEISDPRFELRRIRLVPGSFYYRLSERIGRPDITLFAGRCDVYHFPNFIIHPVKDGKAVVTVHDLSFARFPEWADPRNLERLRRRLPYTLERADAIITVSDFSKRELVELFSVREDRVTVIHNGIRLPEAAGRGKRLEFPYFLFVGTIEPRKNLGALLEAWTIVKGRRGAAWKHRLLVAGGSGWGCPPAAQQVREKGLGKDVLVLDYVNDDDLASLYAGAEALVYPSLYEGFGIPLVEAMARGTPVIASNAPAIPEVVGDAAFLCDPHDPEGIAGALMRIRDDRALRESMVARGLERATLFTRERTARETLTLYRKLLK